MDEISAWVKSTEREAHCFVVPIPRNGQNTANWTNMDLHELRFFAIERVRGTMITNPECINSLTPSVCFRSGESSLSGDLSRHGESEFSTREDVGFAF